MFTIVILDIATRLQRKDSGFILTLNHFLDYMVKVSLE